MTNPPIDMSSPPDLSHEERRIGPFRNQRPIYKDLLSPCNNACPAGEPIQGWLAHAQAGRFEDAWQLIMSENPMPAVMGRVCYHPCETACNRGKLDGTVSIHAVERFLGDMANTQGWMPKYDAQPTGKRVLVIGAGPSGLSAAYHLTRLGHTVEVHEAGPMAGGMMHFGIPKYRLPREELDKDIARIEKMGVKIVLNHKVEDIMAEKQAGNFDAVFVAVGAHLSKRTEIPARDASKMLDAASFLRSVETGNPPKLGRRVAIYGGGNTAMDAARVAQRLGADEALIIYRRTREQMPAHPFEVDEAVEEGVKIHWLRTIKEMGDGELKVEVMALDDKGQLQPTGELETLEADTVIMALGQDTDTGFLRQIQGIEFKSDGVVVVDSNMMTGAAGIFAGGDMVPSERTVTVGIGHGKKAARCMDAYLRGTAYAEPPKLPLATFDKLHLWFYTDVTQRPQSHIDIARRKMGFSEVVAGLSEKDALYEAKRCLSCGNCFECDGCYGSCPENAVIKLGPGLRYQYNYDLCTGCAICYEQCPCHAIEMIPEPASETA